MPDDIDHEHARRVAALQQPNHVLAQPYLDLSEKLEAAQKALLELGAVASGTTRLTPLEQVKILNDALRRIGEIAVEPRANAMPALLEAQQIADDARIEAGLMQRTLKVAKLRDVQE